MYAYTSLGYKHVLQLVAIATDAPAHRLLKCKCDHAIVSDNKFESNEQTLCMTGVFLITFFGAHDSEETVEDNVCQVSLQMFL